MNIWGTEVGFCRCQSSEDIGTVIAVKENIWGPEAVVTLVCSRHKDGLDGPKLTRMVYTWTIGGDRSRRQHLRSKQGLDN